MNYVENTVYTLHCIPTNILYSYTGKRYFENKMSNRYILPLHLLPYTQTLGLEPTPCA